MINFPSNPTTGDVYSFQGRIWRWNGVSWRTIASSYSGNVIIIGGSSGNVVSVNGQTGIVTLSTANVAEYGNLYFTNSRAIGALTAGAGISIASNGRITSTATGGGGGVGDVISVNGANGLVNLFVSSPTTPTNPTLGTIWFKSGEGNLFLYINDGNSNIWIEVDTGAADASVASVNGLVGDVILTTSNITEGANLYFTNTRAVSALTPGTGVDIAANGLITSTALGGVTGINNSNGNVQMFFTSPTVPNANTLGSLWFNPVDGNLSVYISDNTNNFWIEIDQSGASVLSVNGQTGSVVLTTANVAEQSNLYFTNARVYANVIELGYSTNSYVNTRLSSKANVADLTTSNVSELTNLYYTNARVYANVLELGLTTNSYVNTRFNTKANVSDLTTSNVAELTNLYFTNSRVYSNVIELGYATNSYVNTRLDTKANVADLTTENVAELINLYFTNARVLSYLQDIGGNLLPASDIQYSLGSPSRRWKDLYISGNTVYLGNALIEASNTSVTLPPGSEITGQTTDNVAEGNVNLYFTNTRSRAAVSAGTGVIYDKIAGTIAISQNVDITSNVTFQNILVTGNLTVTGNTVSLGVTSLSIEDNMIYLNANSEVTNPDLGFAGNYNDGTYRHTGLFRDATDGVWKFFDNYQPEPDASPYINTSNASFRLANVQVTNLTGNVTGTVTSLENHTTSNLIEGTNLYYTNARVSANVATLGYAPNAYVNTRLLTKANVSDLTTANVSEVTNLYYTNARVYDNVITLGYSTNAYVNTRLLTKANVADLTTANVSELTNLYFTNTRAISALTGGAGIIIAANGRITANVSGGSASVTASNTAPTSPSEGALWLETDNGDVYIYYSNSWVAINVPNYIEPVLSIDQFSGNDSTLTYNLSATPANLYYTTVFVDGVYQSKLTYSITGNSIIFTEAPPTGSNNIEVTTYSINYLPVTKEYKYNKYTANGVGKVYGLQSFGHTNTSILVFENGICQMPEDDYYVSSNAVIFATAPAANVVIQIRELPLT
jgi:hypothetical protein